jgi:short-subunit dehydrogenase
MLIARSFAAANAKCVIMLARRQEQLAAAAETINKEFGRAVAVPRVYDISNESSVRNLWTELNSDGTVVDVLVLSAADLAVGSLLDKNVLDTVRKGFETNVFANLRMAQYMLGQDLADHNRPRVGNLSYKLLLC